MFRRRSKHSLLRRLTDFIWPRIGWRRSTTYLAHRVGRLPGSPYSIAAGFACGAAVSFTPFMGLHFVIAALSSWLIGGNLLASALGTVVGNPWTFPFIWWFIYTLGCLLLGRTPGVDVPDHITLAYIFDHPWQVFLPMAIGGTISAGVAWVACFFPLRNAVAAYQSRRILRRNAAKGRKKSESEAEA